MAMSRWLSFDFDAEKFVHTACYLVARCPDVTKMKLFKLLYFADKRHLLTCGRPIIGDRYLKMDYGPVPSRAYNLIKHDDLAKPEDQELFDDYLLVKGDKIECIAAPNLGHLSVTDLEVFNEVVRDYGQLTAGQLSKISQREIAWENAELNSEMDYRLLFAKQPGTEAIEKLVQEDQELKDTLAEIKFEEQYAWL